MVLRRRDWPGTAGREFQTRCRTARSYSPFLLYQHGLLGGHGQQADGGASAGRAWTRAASGRRPGRQLERRSASDRRRPDASASARRGRQVRTLAGRQRKCQARAPGGDARCGCRPDASASARRGRQVRTLAGASDLLSHMRYAVLDWCGSSTPGPGRSEPLRGCGAGGARETGAAGAIASPPGSRTGGDPYRASSVRPGAVLGAARRSTGGFALSEQLSGNFYLLDRK
jgi:hypothetical protein